jgi:signal transduction histidine kinase
VQTTQDQSADLQSADPQPTRPGVTEVISAVACAVLAIGGALALPLLAAQEPDSGIPSISPSDAVWWVVVALIVLETVALLWAKRSPRLVLSAVALVPIVHALIIPGGTISLTTVAVSFGVFWAVLREPLARLRALLLIVFALVAGSQALNDVRSGAALDVATVAGSLLQAVAVVGIPLVLGLFFAARAQAKASRENEVLALKRERDALIQAAISRERIAMSRELHDIAAHHMSGIALLASAIYRQIDVDPDAAKLSAQQVRAQSKSVLDDLRRVIGLLRDDSETSHSVETLAAVRELVEVRRSAGAPIELVTLTPEQPPGDWKPSAGIGPLAQLVAYRMVQESLANAAVHAPGARCLVEVDDRESAKLTVVVTNDGAHAPDLGPGSGFGLVGMRERADLVAGELRYGATADGGWEVRLTIPRDEIIEDVTEALA